MTEPRLISADSHVNEPGDLWVERIDKQFRDRAPRVVEDLPGKSRVPTWCWKGCRRPISPRAWEC